MQNTPRDRAEQDLLALMRQLHADRGAMEKSALSVTARGRGLEFGRALAGLKTLGLVEEYEHRPFFLRRLFGARVATMLRVTEAGLSTAEADEPPVADPAIAKAPAPATDPVSDLPESDADDSADALPDAPQEPESVPIPSAVAAAVAARKAMQPAPPSAPSSPPAPEPQAEPKPQAEPVPQSEPEPDTAQAPEPAPAPEPRPAPRPRPVTGYTEDLGGIPQDAPAPQPVDPEVMDSLREILEGLGMEMTMAGEALVATRIAQGLKAGEALSQLVLFAFAHAVHHDILSGGAMEALGLADYTVEVMREIEKLRDAGEIEESRFEEDMRRLWALVKGEERAELAQELLADPVGGSAPPALLPEELRHVDEDEDED